MALWGANQWARLTKEVTWGTFDAAATVIHWISIEDDNAITFPRAPQTQTARAATKNIPRRRIAERYGLEGAIRTKVFGLQAIDLIPWALSPTVVSGRLTLPSYTLDWFDGLEVRRILGVRVSRLQLTCDNSSDWLMAAYTLRGKAEGTAPALTEPASSVFPITTDIYTFQRSSTQTLIGTAGGTALANYRSLSFTAENILDVQFDELATLNSADYCGRNVTAEIVKQALTTTEKTWLDAQTPVTLIFKWAITTPTARTLTIDMQDFNYEDNRDVDRSLARNQYATLRFTAFDDLVAGVGDMVATAA